ncbi:MAG: hypothetical protein MAG431_01121 [Chloroflexi bacterium]|nr:hypothetical protein [Chloroflexota bacterium]
MQPDNFPKKRPFYQRLGKFPRSIRAYLANVKKFRRNARLYLVNVIITGLAMGVFRLLLNFYVLSLGYDEALLGRLITTSSLTALIISLPMGYLADVIGRKYSLVLGGIFTGLSIFGLVLIPTVPMFYAMNILSGMAQSLWGITMSPFLMENSGEEERTYLFSFGNGLQMLSAFAGNWVGGYLPTWLGAWQNVSATDSRAYGASMVVVGIVFLLSIVPLVLLRRQRLEHDQRSIFAPLNYARENPGLLGKLIAPLLITSIGAGLVMPFMNVFFRQVHRQPDPVIGTLFAWGSLAMGIGLLVAPALADRIGKIQTVVISQALSVPFLIMLGFSPWFWLSAGAYYIRLTLMNMSTPIYQTFVMENVDEKGRATVASLTSMAWNFGWAFSPTVSGALQVRYGFGPPFVGTISLYIVAITLYWVFFWRKGGKQAWGEVGV